MNVRNILLSIWQVSVYKTTFSAALVGVMFQRKIDKLFNDIPNVFGIAGDIVIAGFDADSMDHNVSLEQVLCTCRQDYLKLKKREVLIQMSMHTILR